MMHFVRLTLSEIAVCAERDFRVYEVERARKRVEVAEAVSEACQWAFPDGGGMERVMEALAPIDAELLRETFPELLVELRRKIDLGVKTADEAVLRDLVEGARAVLDSFSGAAPEISVDQMVAVELARLNRLDRLGDVGPRLVRIENARRSGIFALAWVLAVEAWGRFSRRRVSSRARYRNPADLY